MTSTCQLLGPIQLGRLAHRWRPLPLRPSRRPPAGTPPTLAPDVWCATERRSTDWSTPLTAVTERPTLPCSKRWRMVPFVCSGRV